MPQFVLQKDELYKAVCDHIKKDLNSDFEYEIEMEFEPLNVEFVKVHVRRVEGC